MLAQRRFLRRGEEEETSSKGHNFMWKARPEDNNPMSTNQAQGASSAASSNTAASATTSTFTPPKDNSKANNTFTDRADVGHIGKSVVIRGELTGNEDLYLDGEIEGNIDLRDHKLVIGPNGKIKATITARDIVLHGRVEGNVSATERVELKKSCTLIGDVSTARIVIEDGAFFRGAIDIKEDREHKAESRKPSVSASASSSGSSFGTPATYNATSGSQGSFSEPK
jgi:cytoskeletal protein CcmA (bactofilin family)